MKANELMIGDWVRVIPCKKNGRIYRIDYTNGKGNEYVGVINGDFDIGLLEPIPITPEILEKNGFKRTARGLEWKEILYGYRGQDVSSTSPIEIIYRDGVGGVSNPHIGRVFQGMIDYVHELQHALRLCGIDKEIML